MTSITPNAQRLVRALVVDGPTHRADLARSLDVSRATVTNLTTRLIEDGWVEELQQEVGSLKNPIGAAAGLGVLASVMFLVDSYTVTLARFDGRVLKNLTLTGPAGRPPTERMTAAASLLRTLLVECGVGAGALRALHLAVDTQMDALTGDVFAARASSRWYGVNPVRFFEDEFGVPVHAQNSARLEGLAEYLWGVGSEASDLLYVDVSYGVTSGHVVDGVIRSGNRGGSGELGHTIYDWNGPVCTCGNSGCLMQYVSIPALLRDYATATGAEASWSRFCTQVAADDPDARRIAERAAVILGRVLVSVCHVIDPETVVLNGPVARQVPGFTDIVAATVRELALPLVARNLRVVGAELDDVHAATARAGIESLRRVEAVISSAIPD